jgi:hypothetical protein
MPCSEKSGSSSGRWDATPRSGSATPARGEHAKWDATLTIDTLHLTVRVPTCPAIKCILFIDTLTTFTTFTT